MSARTPAWKLIWAPTLGRYALYDLAHDPTEREDGFATAPEGAALASQLARWRATAPPPPPVGTRNPEAAEKLRALGYVQ